MNRILLFLLMGGILFGCDRFKKDDSPDDEDIDSDQTGTDGEDSASDDSDKESSPDAGRVEIPKIMADGSELPELAEAMEARRLELRQMERDLVQREQMVTRLEYEALSQKDALITLQKETRRIVGAAEEDIEKKYVEEHEKLLKHWENIKEKHKAFIVEHLKYSESQDKESLTAELERLRRERRQRIEQLLKTIEGMNPQSCAMMITSMASDDAVEVMSGLSSTKSAEILSNMTPQKAAELAKGLMGPEVPDVPSLEDVALPEAPEFKDKSKDKSKEKSEKEDKEKQ